MQLEFNNLVWRDDPYRIGLARPVLEESVYHEMIDAFPSESLMVDMGRGYNKLALNERRNPKKFRAFIDPSPLWTAFHEYIKAPIFFDAVHALVGLPPGRYSSRFEFSSLPANGGGLNPHRDVASKIVTLIIPIVRPDDWDPAWGGGTDVLRPLDQAKTLVDYFAPPSEFERVATYEYAPNQCCVFIKTANSWHSVGPITGPAGKWRRTLTVNIERADG